MPIVTRKFEIVNGSWLPDMDLNHDKQIQSLLCYRYTIGQVGVMGKLEAFTGQSSRQSGAGFQPAWLAPQRERESFFPHLAALGGAGWKPALR